MYFLIIFYSWPFWGTESKQPKRRVASEVWSRWKILPGVGFFDMANDPLASSLTPVTEMQCKDHFVSLRLIYSGSTKISPLFRKTLAFLEILWWKFHQTRSWRAVLEDSGGRGVLCPPGITSGRGFQQWKSLITPLRWFTGSSILIPACFLKWCRAPHCLKCRFSSEVAAEDWPLTLSSMRSMTAFPLDQLMW